ncbi:MAG TPA: hypothetical protein VJT75_11035 [Thermoleophilaceae bacterium]|nr:hypothetical protein [Thermoleophilaceae bacterium]
MWIIGTSVCGWKYPRAERSWARVALHADLTILAKLACALALARAVPLAA